MNAELKKNLLLAQCVSMSILLDARLGDANPWSKIPLDSYAVEDLAEAKRLMHELLYAPPPRQ